MIAAANPPNIRMFNMKRVRLSVRRAVRSCGLPAAAMLAMLVSVAAQTPQDTRGGARFSNPPTMATPRGYSHVVEVTGPGRTIYIAGQLGYDKSGKAPEPGDFRAQATQVFDNLKAALQSACASPASSRGTGGCY